MWCIACADPGMYCMLVEYAVTMEEPSRTELLEFISSKLGVERIRGLALYCLKVGGPALGELSLSSYTRAHISCITSMQASFSPLVFTNMSSSSYELDFGDGEADCMYWF